MALLHFLSFIAILAAFAFVTLSLASGLLYVSELIEERSRDAKSIGQRGIYLIILLHLLLYVTDDLPLRQTLFSILCHIIYLQNFSARWPFISLTSLSFIASCILVVADHFLWFFYFARVSQEARHAAHHRQHGPGFADIATFFGVCVWLAPLFLFLSLSAGDNALPTSGPTSATASPSSTTMPIPPALHVSPLASAPSSLFKSLFSILPFSRSNSIHTRKNSDGLIAPRTPTFPQSHSQASSSSIPHPSSPTPNRSYTNSPAPAGPNTQSPPTLLSPRTPGSHPHHPHPNPAFLSTAPPQEFRLGLPPSRRSPPSLRQPEGAGASSTSTGMHVGVGADGGPARPMRRADSGGLGLGLGLGTGLGMGKRSSATREVGYE